MHEYDFVAPFYDFEHDDFRDDIDLYLNLVQDGPLLEIGAGTGRILAPLCRTGLAVWGVEPSSQMRDRATERLARASGAHLVGSLHEIPEEVRFRTALFGLNTLWHFESLEDQLEVLQDVRERLEPGGTLIIDTSNPLTMADRDAAGELRQVFRAAKAGETHTRYAASWDDAGEQMLRLSLTFETLGAGGSVRQTTAELHLRYLYRWELELLVRLAGFGVVAAYGSYDLEPFSSTGPRIVVQARAV
jgi:SAM-dependent methyltransferase